MDERRAGSGRTAPGVEWITMSRDDLSNNEYERRWDGVKEGRVREMKNSFPRLAFPFYGHFQPTMRSLFARTNICNYGEPSLDVVAIRCKV
jgi:hypothetical protein